MTTEAPDIRETNLEYIFNNVIFPPRLPQKAEDEEWRKEDSLLSFVASVTQLFISKSPVGSQTGWHPVAVMLENLKVIGKKGSLSKDDLCRVLENLENCPTMMCYIRAQNCGWIMQYDKQTASVIIDAFEVSPNCDAVLEAKDRLVRHFPGRSVRVPFETANQHEFHEYLAGELARLSWEQISDMMPMTRKARQKVVEGRDTAHPGLVTENLVNQLLALGSHNDCPRFTKHTHDEVNWDDCEFPWRRSPFWLVLRVTLQTLLRRAFGAEQGRIQYKNFMIYLIAGVGTLQLKSSHKANPDTLSLISLKVGRRACKLRDDMFDFVLHSTRSLVTEISGRLRRNIEKKSIPCLPTKATNDDISMSLVKSRNYFERAMAPSPGISQASYDSVPGRTRKHFESSKLPGLSKQDDILTMADFEHWIELHLNHWVSSTEASQNHLENLARLLQTYLGRGNEKYSVSIREKSLMFLVILELWVAMDKMCIQLYPLVKEYSPPVPVNFLEPLVLPEFQQMQRACAVEDYLRRRHDNATSVNPDIFSDPVSDSFAVRFFNVSEKHQKLREKIENWATAKRSTKKHEWILQSNKHSQLLAEANNTDHEYYYTVNGGYHSQGCQKCSLEEQVAQMSITLHEWPLSSNIDELKAAIFELDCPRGFVCWRDASWIVVNDLGRHCTPSKGEKVEEDLLSYSELKCFTSNYEQRLGLGSTTYSWLRTHYDGIHFPVEFSTVCRENGLRLRLLDRKTSTWVQDQKPEPTLKPNLTPLITNPLYSTLESTVASSAHLQNGTLAKQVNCHPQLSQTEFIAFGSLRAGERTQWYNIARELASPYMSFNESAVSVLIRQAAWELGSPYSGSPRRLAHRVFEDREFSSRLLETLRCRLDSIRANWKEQGALSTLVTLALRTLALAEDSGITDDAIKFLRDARKVAFDWCEELSELLNSSKGSDNNTYQHRIIQASSTCQQTYDVDPNHLEHLLADPFDTECLIRSSMIVYENSPSNSVEALPAELREALLRGRKILHKVEHKLRANIRKDSSGINSAVGKSMQGIALSGAWEFVDNHPEIAYKTLRGNTHSRQRKVRYDLLSGEVLIDGHPPGRLPKSYTENDLYRRVFGSDILTVIPSDLPGSVYAAAKKFGNFELVPRGCLEDDFPWSLVHNFDHWLNTKTGDFEFRPVDNRWQSSPSNWHLQVSLESPRNCVMRRGDRTLIDIRSNLSCQILRILQTLDSPEHIHITESAEGVIEAELVRLGLTFFVNDRGFLECRELTAIVDPEQDIECLYGLSSKLAMKSSKSEDIVRRSVVIPYGQIDISRGHSCVRVTINNPPKYSRVKYFRYWLNEHLRTLQGPHDMLSSLYRCYLHAVTGYVVPDPFTGRLGTDEALRGLRQPSLMMPMPLDSDCISILKRISKLTPKRELYPKHLRVMQTVTWNSTLSQLVQHDDFSVVAAEIVRHALRFSPFNKEIRANEYQLCCRGDSGLLTRAQLINARWRPADFGGTLASPREELIYGARDKDYSSERGRQVYEIATLIRDWPSKVHHADLVEEAKNWSQVSAGRLDWTCAEEYSLLIPKAFGSLYDFCRQASREADTFRLMSIFCMITYGDKNKVDLIRTFLAIAFSGRFRDSPIPSQQVQECHMWYPFSLSEGEDLKASDVRAILENCCIPFTGNSSTFETAEEARELRLVQNEYELDMSAAVRSCRHWIEAQWLNANLNLEESPEISHTSRYIKLADALKKCRQLFVTWYGNKLFMNDLREVQQQLQEFQCSEAQEWTDPPACQVEEHDILTKHPTLERLIASSTPSTQFPSLEPVSVSIPIIPYAYSSSSSEIRALISQFQQKFGYRWKDYSDRLLNSLNTLEKSKLRRVPREIPIKRQDLVGYKKCLQELRDEILSEALHMLEPRYEDPLRVAYEASLWPSVTVHSLLSYLSCSKFQQLSPAWKKLLVSLGTTISAIQRCERLLTFFDCRDVSSFYKEAENVGQQGWNPLEDPEWLLLEIEQNLTIRSLQAEVAHQLIHPDFGENTALQLNMGEGKTSVITPMVVSKLADGNCLARVIVLKPLLRQSISLLSHRLGGLINRRVYHIPFSRNTDISANDVASLQDMYRECKQQQGIMVALPEHILSFRLVGMDMHSKDPEVAEQVLKLERQLQRECRDVIDESDEILHPRFQLVYTMGNQEIVDGDGDRWEVSQKIFHLVEEYARKPNLHGLETDCDEVTFPKLKFLQREAVDKLMEAVIDCIRQGKIPGIPFNQWRPEVRESALNFIRCRLVAERDAKTIAETFRDNICFNRLLVLRGLFAHDILEFSLQGKRWRVEYGLDPSRCMMAVPFRAKDVPSENSEFGHPDVAILLTCLSYYYQGLTCDQVLICFSLLLKEDDGATEYQRWIERGKERLPVGLRDLTGANLDDVQSFQSILYPHLRYQKWLIDFYLSRVVFPREAKQFERKLSTSAWDIPSRTSNQPTTGFSGTNDNSSLLPLTLKQTDLPHLMHTNAMVLGTLLQEENQTCILAQDNSGRQLGTAALLKLLPSLEPRVQVLIDVGAQVLELENEEVAKEWLAITPGAEAAVYFDKRDEAMVIDRHHHVERLLASSYHERLDKCLVFLDQHHSRGVDLKLPTHFRAAVTLGPRLTKDRLVQGKCLLDFTDVRGTTNIFKACNRLRKLGDGQTVVFLSPPQVTNRIREVTGKLENQELGSADVILWTLVETCESMDNLRPLWASQGLDYCRRWRLWKLLKGTDDVDSVVYSMQEPEARPLVDLYGPWQSHTSLKQSLQENDTDDPVAQKLRDASQSFNFDDTVGHLLHEEQEREIAWEVERERQVERPPAAKPASHKLDAELRYYVEHGTFRKEKVSMPFIPAFESLKSTTASKFSLPGLFPELLVTVDFMNTIKPKEPDDFQDEFVKPVNWVLSSIHNNYLIIISQYEANELLPYVERSENTRLHVYAPRVTKTMTSFRKFDFLTIGQQPLSEQQLSALPIQALEFFAGNLYFDSFTLYRDFCSFLGFMTDQMADSEDIPISCDGFVSEDGRRRMGWPVACPFRESPLRFVNALTSIQRRGQGFQRSHVGQIIERMVLTERDF
ncbi:hypothetical protein PRK78_007184 [Emydomyces testavorans]|uniref:ubiquitinyl hydrolase 1 n=1 Tax=Emydomyces testavorans TaxID=2070801 RepID=A0AAF0IMI2_9EURO|nr:hypothetical protein PRK78_007184 [Emydomyces testavorans]